ncbi:hypothetical protein QJS66_01610 [Kocuria rhizophila]|nr:hypothetical protein QJS66_01610 [Kocuria rhizophila]
MAPGRGVSVRGAGLARSPPAPRGLRRGARRTTPPWPGARAHRLCDLMDCHVTDLSGGQRQRAWIALALAQQTTRCCWTSPPPIWTSPGRWRSLHRASCSVPGITRDGAAPASWPRATRTCRGHEGRPRRAAAAGRRRS